MPAVNGSKQQYSKLNKQKALIHFNYRDYTKRNLKLTDLTGNDAGAPLKARTGYLSDAYRSFHNGMSYSEYVRS